MLVPQRHAGGQGSDGGHHPERIRRRVGPARWPGLLCAATGDPDDDGRVPRLVGPERVSCNLG